MGDITILVIGEEAHTHTAAGVLTTHAPITLLPLTDREQAVDALIRYRPDLVLLCVAKPADLHAIAVLRQRVHDLVVIAWLDDPQLLLPALDAGADEAFGHHTPPDEALARMAAVLRTARRASDSRLSVNTDAGVLVMDREAGTLHLDGRGIELTGMEWAVLEQLMRAPGSFLPASRLIATCWKDPQGDETKVKYVIARLRTQLRPFGLDTHVTTIRGRGYGLRTI